MKYITVLLLSLFLIGCSDPVPQVIVKQTHTVIIPDTELFKCPIVTLFPKTETLTDIQVARLLTQVYNNNLVCKNSMEAIKRFLEKAKLEYEKGG